MKRSLLAVPFFLLLLALVAAACSGGEDTSTEDSEPDAGQESTDETTDDDAGPDDDAGTDGEADAEASGDGDGAMAEGEGFPVTIESAGGTWTLEAAPERIVSLSPMATELLFAIGAGDQVVAADEYSTYPPEAPTSDLSGFDPNIEAIAAYDPDLLVIANDANDMIASFTALGVPVLVSPPPTDLEQGYAEITTLGAATGRSEAAAETIDTLRSELAAAFAAGPDVEVRVYHEIDETFYSASSNSFIGAVYTEFGATNIADDADTDGFGFPQLTEEYIVDADPQVIVITDQVAYSPQDVASRPGWGDVAAVRDNNVVVVNADAASRWGPRLPEFVSAVATALTAVEAG